MKTSFKENGFIVVQYIIDPENVEKSLDVLKHYGFEDEKAKEILREIGLALIGTDLFESEPEDDISETSIKYNHWYNDLIWCPSQCYYYYKEDNKIKCIYLRWRHNDPWTMEIITCDKEPSFIGDLPGDDIWTKRCKQVEELPFFKDSQLSELQEWALKYIHNK